MFGVLYTIFVSIGLFFHKLKESAENTENKTKFKNPDGLTYIDTRGSSRLLSNDEMVFYMHDKNGDYVLKNASGHVYKNFSEEKRNKFVEESLQRAKINNETTYCIDDDDHDSTREIKGRRFKDFKTGAIYVIRRINYKYYYMDISTGMIVRKTDYQIREDEKEKKLGFEDDPSKSIEYTRGGSIDAFNEKQKEFKTNGIYIETIMQILLWSHFVNERGIKMVKLYNILNDDNNRPILNTSLELDTNGQNVSIEESVEILNKFFHMDSLGMEHNYIIGFDDQHNITGIFLASIGSSREVRLYKRSIATFLLLSGTTSFVAYHNHPGAVLGVDPEALLHASDADERCIYWYEQLAEDLEMKFIESVIISRNGWHCIRSGEGDSYDDDME